MQKKITELLQILDDRLGLSEWYYHSVVIFADYSGEILDNKAERLVDFTETDMNVEITKMWNSLTGENLKDVTWIL